MLSPKELNGQTLIGLPQDEMERRADKDRTTVERFEQLEGNQAKILGLLRKIDEGEDGSAPRRR